MNEKLKNSLASVEMEGFTFTGEQIEFICNIVERIERCELTWDEASQLLTRLKPRSL